MFQQTKRIQIPGSLMHYPFFFVFCFSWLIVIYTIIVYLIWQLYVFEMHGRSTWTHFQYVCLFAAVEEFGVQPEESRFVHNLKSTWFKKAEITKEPYLCSLRNLLLYFPGTMFQIMICCLNFHLISFAFWHIMNMVEYLHDIHHMY